MRYYVEKCIYWDRYLGDVRGWQINSDSDEMFWVNLWLSNLTSNTAKQYTYKLCKFLNYLQNKKMNYKDAKLFDLESFIHQLRFKTDEDIYNIGESKECHSTISGYISAISSFYKYLQLRNQEFAIQMQEKIVDNKYSFLYGITWNKSTVTLLTDKFISKYKPKKQYIKWYTDQEINAIYSSLYKLRDCAVFALSLCGMRSDEILSLRMEDYNPSTKSVIAYRSKGRETGATNRVVSLDKVALRYLEDYLINERINVEIELIKENKLICNEIFVGLKRNEGFGQPLKYGTFRSILRRGAKRIAINEKEIRTHSGRSTAVMRDLLFHAEHPEILSLEAIQFKYGWANIKSMDPYLDTSNPKLSIQNRRLLDSVKKRAEERLSDRYEDEL